MRSQRSVWLALMLVGPMVLGSPRPAPGQQPGAAEKKGETLAPAIAKLRGDKVTGEIKEIIVTRKAVLAKNGEIWVKVHPKSAPDRWFVIDLDAKSADEMSKVVFTAMEKKLEIEYAYNSTIVAEYVALVVP